MNKPRQWKTWLQFATVLALLLLVSNPEWRALLFLVDYAGFELLGLLIVLQFRDLAWHAWHGLLRPFYRFLCRMSVLPCWLPSWRELRRQPSLILLAFPFDSAIVLACIALLGYLLLSGAPLRFHLLR